MNAAPQARESHGGQAEDARVRLLANFQILDDAVRVEYQVTSKGGGPLLLFDALKRPAHDGTPKYDRLLAYVAFEEPSTLGLKRLVAPLPQLKDVEMAQVPWAHKLMPGGVVNGEIRVPLPAEEYSPYYPPGPKSAYRKASAGRLKLVLGYVELGGELQAVAVEDAPGLFELYGAGATLRQIEVVVRLDKPVPVKRRSDMFEPV